MKKMLFFVFSSALYLGSQAQTASQLKQIDETRKFLATTDYVYPYMDTPAGYAGGNEKWLEYQKTSTVLKDAVRKAKEQNAPAGKYVVTVKFSIAPDGNLTDVKTVNKPVGYGLEEAAITFVKGSGKWIPANIEGENTKSTINLPITFTIAY